MIDADSIGLVLDVYRPERRVLLDLLGELDLEQWAASTECPQFTVKGIATHLRGDDLSLLSRQRDGPLSDPVGIAAELPGSDLRALLDTFNERLAAGAHGPGSTLEMWGCGRDESRSELVRREVDDW